MAALERDAQYKNAEIKVMEQAQKEMGIATATKDYRDVAGNPAATREEVYGATQRAFGRILGYDAKAAEAFAKNSEMYPKFFPTDTNVTEVEAYINDAKKKGLPESIGLMAYDEAVTSRGASIRQANTVRGGRWKRISLPNGGYEFINDEGKIYDYRTKQLVDAPPELKLMAPQSYSGSRDKAVELAKGKAIEALAKLCSMQDKGGGTSKLDAANALYEKALELPANMQIPEEDLQNLKPEEIAKKYPEQSKALMSTLKIGGGSDTAALILLKEALTRGREYRDAISNLNAAQAIYKGFTGEYIKEDLASHPVTPQTLTPRAKLHMQKYTNWKEVKNEELAIYADEEDQENYMPEAEAEFLRRVNAGLIKPQ
jgi:hypothetical protein